jgi:hypothetical protein
MAPTQGPQARLEFGGPLGNGAERVAWGRGLSGGELEAVKEQDLRVEGIGSQKDRGLLGEVSGRGGGGGWLWIARLGGEAIGESSGGG